MYSSTLSLTSALDGCEWSTFRPGRSLPPGKTRYPLYRRLGGPQGRSGQVWKMSLLPGFDLRPVQPVAQSLYGLSYRAHWTQDGQVKFSTETCMVCSVGHVAISIRRKYVLSVTQQSAYREIMFCMSHSNQQTAKVCSVGHTAISIPRKYVLYVT
jgi:hypothetical protein